MDSFKIKNLLTTADLSKTQILDIINLAEKIKKDPPYYRKRLDGKTLLMLFAEPSLRTHLSFDIAMYQLGGHAIFYDMSHSTLGKKESIKDFAKVISRYTDCIMARVKEHKEILELVKYSTVPVINGLTNYYHPCQVIGDLLTIKETLKTLSGKKIIYIGDSNNNVTHDLIICCNKVGINITICSPKKREFMPNKELIKGSKFTFQENPRKAVKDADIIYTDTWMSYHIPESKKKARMQFLKQYQVNMKLMNISPKAKFMHCLPAHRGDEVTDDVMDSNKSIIYNQAENRTYVEKAILLTLLK